MVTRNVVAIDETLCDGCGRCVTPCAEGAIQVVNGKATVLKDEICDGAGFCVAVCPRGALSITRRKTHPFSAKAVAELNKGRGKEYVLQKCFRCGNSEKEALLFPCRRNGDSIWVCIKCFPPLIHG